MVEIVEEKMVSLNEDNKAVCLKSIKDLFFAAKQLHEWLAKDELSVEMKDTLISLVESHTADFAEVLEYDSEAAQRIDCIFGGIRQANMRIRELEHQLADKNPVSGVKELLREMHDGLYSFWNLQGFNLVTDDTFGSNGYRGRFLLSLSTISIFPGKPVTEKQNRKNKLQQMINDGYELVLVKGDREYVLLDTPTNRKKITELLRAAFQSVKIIKWNNYHLKDDDFKLWDVEVIIYDLAEIKSVIDSVKTIKDED